MRELNRGGLPDMPSTSQLNHDPIDNLSLFWKYSSMRNCNSVHGSLTEMIKLAANEPSVGLFFVQQHVQKSAPRLLSIKNKVEDTSQEAFVCTEDMKDALNSVKSMKECGSSIIERTIKNLNSSISAMSSLHQLRGNGGRPDQPKLSGKASTIRAVWDSTLQKASTSHWRSRASDACQITHHNRESNSATCEKCDESKQVSSGTDLGPSKRYLSRFKSVLQRAGTFGWSRADINNTCDASVEALTKNSTTTLKCVSSTREYYEPAMNDFTISASSAVGQESTAFSTEDVDTGNEMDEGNQLPVSSQALFDSDYDSEIEIPEEAQDVIVPMSDTGLKSE